MITHVKEYLHVHSLDCNFFNFIFMLCKYFIQNTIQVIVIKFTIYNERRNPCIIVKCFLSTYVVDIFMINDGINLFILRLVLFINE